MIRALSIVVALLLLLVLSGCRAGPSAGGDEPLRIAVLPITDSIPFFVAAQEGYFEEEGVSVELVPVASAPDRDILLQSDGAEGILTDLVSAAAVNGGEGAELVLVRQLRSAFPDEPMFYLVSGPNSGISTVADLAGREIGVSENSIIEYYTDRLLTAQGLARDEIVMTGVPQLPVRMQLLMEGQLPAAVLPDPLASLAILQGATLVTSDAELPEISQSVLAFDRETVESRRDAVAAAVRAYDRAVEAINADPAAFQDLLIANTSVPEPLQQSYLLPRFPVRALPTRAQFDDVNAWALEQGLIPEAQSYDRVVDASLGE